eukprot:7901704-Prorocentrum_lima.AAC.1
MEFFVIPSQPTQMVSMFYDIESPMHVWDDTHHCYITSHDEETDCEVELYLPQHMAHWFPECPQELHADE